MGTATTLDRALNLASETACSVIGVDAISILVHDRSSNVPVEYLVSGKVTNPAAKKLLKGEHELCEKALKNREAVFEIREIKSRNGIRSLAVFPLVAQGSVIGMMNVIQEDRFNSLKTGQLHLLSIIASKVASAIENNRLSEHLQSSYLKAIKALANAIEARDRYTRGHTDRVTVLANLIATRLGWSEDKCVRLKMGCTLHDIGKIGIPDAILNKPGRLSSEERAQIEVHPILGAKILEGIDFLKPAIPYILYHHEKYDGSGYPHGLKGDDIPQEGRLLAVVDTYDAIVSDRPYRKGVAPEEAINELIKFKGRQFDPIIVEVLVKAWKEGLIDRLGIYPNEVTTEPCEVNP